MFPRTEYYISKYQTFFSVEFRNPQLSKRGQQNISRACKIKLRNRYDLWSIKQFFSVNVWCWFAVWNILVVIPPKVIVTVQDVLTAVFGCSVVTLRNLYVRDMLPGDCWHVSNVVSAKTMSDISKYKICIKLNCKMAVSMTSLWICSPKFKSTETLGSLKKDSIPNQTINNEKSSCLFYTKWRKRNIRQEKQKKCMKSS